MKCRQTTRIKKKKLKTFPSQSLLQKLVVTYIINVTLGVQVFDKSSWQQGCFCFYFVFYFYIFLIVIILFWESEFNLNFFGRVKNYNDNPNNLQMNIAFLTKLVFLNFFSFFHCWVFYNIVFFFICFFWGECFIHNKYIYYMFLI